MGFGFVEFVRASHAHEALRRLQAVELDGHRLQLKLSQRGAGAETSAGTSATTSATTATGKRKTMVAPVDASGEQLPPSAKILVKNLAFECGPKDLRQLFGTFGQVRSIEQASKQRSNR